MNILFSIIMIFNQFYKIFTVKHLICIKKSQKLIMHDNSKDKIDVISNYL